MQIFKALENVCAHKPNFSRFTEQLIVISKLGALSTSKVHGGREVRLLTAFIVWWKKKAALLQREKKYLAALSYGYMVHFNPDCRTEEKAQETKDNTAHIYILSTRHGDSQGVAETLTLRKCQVQCSFRNLQ